MTMVVGFAPDGRGRAVLHLAAMLARSGGEDLVVCAVIPAPWPPSPARVDAEYLSYLEGAAENALSRARARLPADIPARYEVKHARSAPAGLLELAEGVDASIVVVGSAADGGSGLVSVGSVSARLLHSSHVPVALAPRGFHARENARVERVTAAFGGSDDDLVVAAAGVAARVGASLRIASFAVRARPPYTAGVGREADESMTDQWVSEITASARAAAAEVEGLPAVPRDLECVVGQGEDWGEALEDVPWHDGDVLVVGSSSIGPVARVFLGSRSTKIVRHSPVPVVVVPRGRAAELAEAAEAATDRSSATR
ncbi:MAG TPA: universal stress protein [Solirubrobacteraceae bacterium]|jgi:nucleotide-binding universal stress UspA family protein